MLWFVQFVCRRLFTVVVAAAVAFLPYSARSGPHVCAHRWLTKCRQRTTFESNLWCDSRHRQKKKNIYYECVINRVMWSRYENLYERVCVCVWENEMGLNVNFLWQLQKSRRFLWKYESICSIIFLWLVLSELCELVFFFLSFSLCNAKHSLLCNSCE